MQQLSTSIKIWFQTLPVSFFMLLLCYAVVICVFFILGKLYLVLCEPEIINITQIRTAEVNCWTSYTLLLGSCLHNKKNDGKNLSII